MAGISFAFLRTARPDLTQGSTVTGTVGQQSVQPGNTGGTPAGTFASFGRENVWGTLENLRHGTPVQAAPPAATRAEFDPFGVFNYQGLNMLAAPLRMFMGITINSKPNRWRIEGEP